MLMSAAPHLCVAASAAPQLSAAAFFAGKLF